MTLVAPAHTPLPDPLKSRSHRDPAVDLVRAACLIAVVTVHALMVGVSLASGDTGGGVVIENALESWSGFTVFSWVAQMMPLFFVLGGFASATHLRRLRGRGVSAGEYVALRLRRLLPVPLAAAGAVVLGLSALTVLVLDAELVAEAGWRISQPLWFLGVYVLCSSLVPAALRLHERAPGRTLAVLGAVVLCVDVLRGVSGVDAVGFANLLFVWLFVQQLGFWLADGSVPSLRAAGWAVAGIATLMVLGASPANLFEALNPPTAALALLGVVQLALFAAARDRLRVWASLPGVQRISNAINGAAMTIYSWHMPVVIAVAGLLLATGTLTGSATLVPVPLTPEWWLSRPLWLIVAGGAVAAVVAATARIERRPDPHTSVVTATGIPAPLGATRILAAVLTGAGGVLVILAATGALWAWVCGLLLMGLAIRLATPGRVVPPFTRANPAPALRARVRHPHSR